MTNSAALLIKRSAQARRLSLRLDTRGGHFVLTLPKGVSQSEALHFARSQKEWMVRTLEALPGRLPFIPGALLPFLGTVHRLRHEPALPARLVPRRDAFGDNELIVGGIEAGFETRVQNWLKRQAKFELNLRAQHFSEKLGIAFHAISVGDPKSRWGSCSARRCLSFSWRLVMTPPDVMDYVVAHEVAHLKEMNHSPAFWKTVAGLMPGYEKERRWLKAHAVELARYGPRREQSGASPTIISF